MFTLHRKEAMKVQSITAKAGRTFNHPYESYSNLRCDVEMSAVLEPGDDPAASVKELQARAETLCEQHKQQQLESLHMLEEQQRLQARRMSLEDQISRHQNELDQIKAKQEPAKLTAPSPEPCDDYCVTAAPPSWRETVEADDEVAPSPMLAGTAHQAGDDQPF
jgi:hypothetical protein